MSKRKYREGPPFTSLVEMLSVILAGESVWDFHAGRARNAAFLRNRQLHDLNCAYRVKAYVRAIPIEEE